MGHVEAGQQACLGQIVVQGEERLAHERWRLQVAKNMGNEVAGVDIARIPLLVNSPGTGLQGTIIIDDDFVYTKDGQSSGDTAGSSYPLVCGLQAGTGQY